MGFPIARRYEPLTPEKWNEAREFVLALQLIAGANVRLKSSPHGTIISAQTSGPPWAHPFKVSLASATSAQIAPGFVNLIEPEIEKVPLSGTDKEPPPVLQWEKLKLDQEGRGFIALETESGEKWELEKGKVTVVQVAYLDSDDGETPPANTTGKTSTGGVPLLKGRRARWPLAMLRQRKSGAVDLFQITFGDLQFRAQPRDAKAESGRAFFW